VDQGRRCDNCTAVNPAAARFCSSCGTPFAQPPSHDVATPPGPPPSRPTAPSKSKSSSTRNGCIGCLGVIIVLFVGAAIIGSNGSGSTADKSSTKTTQQATENAQPDTAAAPNPAPQLSRKEQKRNFLATVDESISGARIVGNPYKFVGTNVDLHCVISDIPQADFLNATCPPDDYGLGPNIVVQTDTRSLEKGQHIRVIGTVIEPMEGNNAMGGVGHFPTVKAEFME
jgi:hypothetical protein